jgi:predicted HNH restriction endonuclease
LVIEDRFTLMYLLQVNRAGDIYKDDNGAVLVPEFQSVLQAEGLGQLGLKWVALVCDYESPYRHFTESERRKAVNKDLMGSYKWKQENDPKIQAAVEKYKAMQFDPLDEQLLAFNKKITQFTDYMNGMHIDEDTAESLQKIMIGIEKIYKTRQTLVDAIERRGERQKIAGDKKLSYLERRKELQEQSKNDS